jgi:hypothetical protein
VQKLVRREQLTQIICDGVTTAHEVHTRTPRGSAAHAAKVQDQTPVPDFVSTSYSLHIINHRSGFVYTTLVNSSRKSLPGLSLNILPIISNTRVDINHRRVPLTALGRRALREEDGVEGLLVLVEDLRGDAVGHEAALVVAGD